jgi:hypothetical protein
MKKVASCTTGDLRSSQPHNLVGLVTTGRNCPHNVSVMADASALADLQETMRRCAGNSDRWVEVQPGRLVFHFEEFDASFVFAVQCHDQGYVVTAS